MVDVNDIAMHVIEVVRRSELTYEKGNAYQYIPG